MKSATTSGFLCALLGVAFTSFLGSTEAAPIVTASHTFPPGGGFFHTGAGIGTDNGMVFDNRKAQTFTTGVGGMLDTVSFIASRLSGTTADLRVSITNLTDGQPSPTIATTTLDVDSFMEGSLTRPLAFNSSATFRDIRVSLAAQSEYAIVFSTDTTEANYRLYGDRSGYPGGQQLRSQNGSEFMPPILSSDLFFEVSVDVVPEPSTSVLSAFGLIGLFTYGWRRRRGT